MISAVFPPGWAIFCPGGEERGKSDLIEELSPDVKGLTSHFLGMAEEVLLGRSIHLLATCALPGFEDDSRHYMWMAIHSGVEELVPLGRPEQPLEGSSQSALKVTGTYVTPRMPEATLEDPCFGAKYWLLVSENTYFEVACEVFTAHYAEAVEQLWDAIVEQITLTESEQAEAGPRSSETT